MLRFLTRSLAPRIYGHELVKVWMQHSSDLSCCIHPDPLHAQLACCLSHHPCSHQLQ